MSKLRSLREEKGIEQSTLAALLGIGISSYSRKENSIYRFNLTEARLLAEYFGLTIEDIFFEDEVAQNTTTN